MRSSSLRFLTWVGLVNLLPHYLPLQAAASMEANTIPSSEGDVPKAPPFLVSIQKRDIGDKNNQDQPGDHLCGGALLAEDTVLTSAHCALQLPTFHYQIVAGTHVLGGLFGRQRRLVSRIVVHPYYNRNTYGRMLYNVAIIFVKNPFDFNDHVYAKLPRFDDTPKGKAQFFSWGSDASRYTKERVKIREPVTVTSFLVITCFALSSFLFGFSGPGYASAALFVVTTGITVTEMLKEEEIEILLYDERHLKTETYRILSQMQCEKQITHFKDKNDWHNNLLCTKPFPGKSVYDSGGLLVQDGVLVGIWCRITEYNSFFLRVSAFRKWIEEQIRS